MFQREDTKTKLVKLNPSAALLHHVLAVSFAENVEEEILQSNVAGFICM